jgi:hypothetical protein
MFIGLDKHCSIVYIKSDPKGVTPLTEISQNLIFCAFLNNKCSGSMGKRKNIGERGYPVSPFCSEESFSKVDH